jgi:hypothetical protein
MTTLRRNAADISNYFDRLTQGIGHRGSSFTDVDRLCITHDLGRGRALFQEFKHEGEQLPIGQRRALEWLATQPALSVWLVTKRKDGNVALLDFRARQQIVLTESDYQRRFRQWWEGAARAIAQEAPQTAETFTATTEFALCSDGSLCIDRSHRGQWIGGIGVARCAACWKRGLAA